MSDLLCGKKGPISIHLYCNFSSFISYRTGIQHKYKQECLSALCHAWNLISCEIWRSVVSLNMVSIRQREPSSDNIWNKISLVRHLLLKVQIKFSVYKQTNKQPTNQPNRCYSQKISRSAQQQARLKIRMIPCIAGTDCKLNDLLVWRLMITMLNCKIRRIRVIITKDPSQQLTAILLQISTAAAAKLYIGGCTQKKH